MPRLRRLKIYDTISVSIESTEEAISLSDNSDISEVSDNSEILNGDEREESTEFDELSEDDERDEREQDFKPVAGWWSNSSIIASLPTEKIKSSLQNYRTLIALLEDELIARKFITHENYPLDFKNLRQARRETYATSGKNIKGTKRRSRFTMFLRRQRLSMAQVSTIEEVWSQLLKEHYYKK